MDILPNILLVGVSSSILWALGSVRLSGGVQRVSVGEVEGYIELFFFAICLMIGLVTAIDKVLKSKYEGGKSNSGRGPSKERSKPQADTKA